MTEKWHDAKSRAWQRLCEKTAALGVAFAEFDLAQREYGRMEWADDITAHPARGSEDT
jgi:hypothetical protein